MNIHVCVLSKEQNEIGQKIDIDKIDYKKFFCNPIVLYNFDTNKNPIGKVLSIYKKDQELWAELNMPDYDFGILGRPISITEINDNYIINDFELLGVSLYKKY